MNTAIKQYLGADWERFQTVFTESLHSDVELLDKINNYLFGRSGKQLRPILCLLAARACSGGCSSTAIDCAAAVEIIHTATLLHDDVADNSAERRGSPTVQSFVSPRASVLLGDFWLSRAILTILKQSGKEIIASFASCLSDLAEGEILQLQKADSMDTTMDDYVAIISRKTASLFRTAVCTGAYAEGAPCHLREALDQYALHLGLAFQMRDDMLDYSPHLATGKPAGQDIMEKKITLPLLGAFEKADAAEIEVVKKQMLQGEASPVLEFARSRNGLVYAQDIVVAEAEKAVASLAPLPDSQAKELLAKHATKLCNRTF